jgi:hypothetical protein
LGNKKVGRGERDRKNIHEELRGRTRSWKIRLVGLQYNVRVMK